MADKRSLKCQCIDTGAWLRHMGQSVVLPTGKLHLALPASGTAGVAIPHPHTHEGIVGDLPFMPNAKDPTVGIPAKGLLMLGHIVEWAELVLVHGLHQAEALARESEEMCWSCQGRRISFGLQAIGLGQERVVQPERVGLLHYLHLRSTGWRRPFHSKPEL